MIIDYKKEWSKKYLKESEKIKKVFGNELIDIQHIGSTSVPGLAAKPIIDIAVLVISIEDISKYKEMINELGYEYKPELSSGERIFSRKGRPIEYHLSIASPDTNFLDRQVKFRDFLITNPEYKNKYEEIKKEAFKRASDSEREDLTLSKKYNSMKTPIIEEILNIIYRE